MLKEAINNDPTLIGIILVVCLIGITLSLFTFARNLKKKNPPIEPGELLNLHPRDMDSRQLINRVKSEAERLASAKNIKTAFNISFDLSGPIFVDDEKILELVTGIFREALVLVHAGSSVTVGIQPVFGDVDDATYVFSILLPGVVITNERKKTVDIATALRLANLMDGRIEIHNDDESTTFEIYLPIN